MPPDSAFWSRDIAAKREAEEIERQRADLLAKQRSELGLSTRPHFPHRSRNAS